MRLHFASGFTGHILIAGNFFSGLIDASLRDANGGFEPGEDRSPAGLEAGGAEEPNEADNAPMWTRASTRVVPSDAARAVPSED